ncbi:MAG: hypothetical protein ABI988_20550 [Nitrospirota bacterium]
MAQMTAVHVSSPGGAFAVVKLPSPEPEPNTVVSRVRIGDILNFRLAAASRVDL